MYLINVTNLTFAYEGSYDNIFKNVSFQIYTLYKGEQTKALLAAMFLKENSFLLIDKPTNHSKTIKL